MRPKQRQTTGSSDLFRARLDQIINMKHELVQLAGKLDWAWIDGGCGEAAPYSTALRFRAFEAPGVIPGPTAFTQSSSCEISNGGATCQ
jgi:hypothetical protein